MILQTLAIIAAVLADNPQKPLEYLDPGSGSFIFQLIIASLLGAAVVIRAYWKRIAGIFKNTSEEDTEEEEEE